MKRKQVESINAAKKQLEIDAPKWACEMALRMRDANEQFNNVTGTSLLSDLIRVYYSKKHNRLHHELWGRLNADIPETCDGEWGIRVVGSVGKLYKKQ